MSKLSTPRIGRVGAFALSLICSVGAAGFSFAQDQAQTQTADRAQEAADANRPATYDENATAESLGLEPYKAPDGLFPVFPWDHLEDWGRKYQPIDEAIRSMAECGCTLSGFVAADDELALCKENGLYCILEAHVSRDMLLEGDAAKIDAAIAERVEATKDDPTVLGYSLIDEPGVQFFKGLAAAVESIKKRAPGKLAYINLFPGYASTIGADRESQLGTYSYREYLERFVQEVKPQLLSYDNYMVEYSEDTRSWERAYIFFTDLFEVREVALKYNLPFWYIGSSLCILEPSSPPSPARYAYQAYTALAAGAEGLTWFLYYPLGWKGSPIDENGKKTLSWVYMRDINEQAKIVGGFLKGYRSTAIGVSKLYEANALPKLPELPTNLLKNVAPTFSTQGVYRDDEKPTLMIGEFAAKDGDSAAALAVNLNFGTSTNVKFDMPDGYKTLKIVNPVDGSVSPVSDEARANGFWILPGHGTLFVFEK